MNAHVRDVDIHDQTMHTLQTISDDTNIHRRVVYTHTHTLQIRVIIVPVSILCDGFLD